LLRPCPGCHRRDRRIRRRRGGKRRRYVADRIALVKAQSRRLDALCLQPGADFRGYTKVMLDPTPVAFAREWNRDINQTMDLMRRTTPEEARQIVDMWITAPENLTTSPRTRVYAAESGEATLVLQFHESTTGALLGRAVDRSIAGDRGNLGNRAGFRLKYRISTVWNHSDFEAVFATWASASVRSFEELTAQSPAARVTRVPVP
jgi:hypothetical protein